MPYQSFWNSRVDISSDFAINLRASKQNDAYHLRIRKADMSHSLAGAISDSEQGLGLDSLMPTLYPKGPNTTYLMAAYESITALAANQNLPLGRIVTITYLESEGVISVHGQSSDQLGGLVRAITREMTVPGPSGYESSGRTFEKN